jgi:hypothetical protein
MTYVHVTLTRDSDVVNAIFPVLTVSSCLNALNWSRCYKSSREKISYQKASYLEDFFTLCVPSRVARSFLVQHTKMGQNTPNEHTLYQGAIKYTYPKAVKYTNIFSFQGPPKYTQIGCIGMQIYHPATLVSSVSKTAL